MAAMLSFDSVVLPPFTAPFASEPKSPAVGLELGVAVNDGVKVCLTDSDLRHGTLIAGRTGVGKSKLAEWLLRQLLIRRSGHADAGATFVFDPHWSLACDVMNFASACRLELPILAIDPASDPLVAYDPIRSTSRQRNGVAADQFATWMAHAWRRGDDEAAPLLESNLKLIVRSLLDAGLTLAQAQTLVDPDAPAGLRSGILARLRDPTLRRKWERLLDLSTGSFLSQMGSAARALARIPERANIMLGQPSSFSFDRAIEEGWFVFIRTGGEDGVGPTIASIMLDDLWNAIRSRKGSPKPVHVLIDEATQLCGPHTVEMLNGGRKFDLRLILLMQSATQLKRLGEAGRRAFDEIMLDCLNKVCMAVDTASASSIADDLGTTVGRLTKLARMRAMVHTLSMPPGVSVEVATNPILPMVETAERRAAYLSRSMAEQNLPFAYARIEAIRNLQASYATVEDKESAGVPTQSDEPDEFTRVLRGNG